MPLRANRCRSIPAFPRAGGLVALGLAAAITAHGRSRADADLGVVAALPVSARPVLLPVAPRWADASASHLPGGVVVARSSMDAAVLDLEGDGDLDLVLAIEFGANVILRNEGAGRFVDATPAAFRSVARDSEDIALGDFDRDGDLDIVFVSEDDLVDEYYLGDGRGGYIAAPSPLPATGVSNAVVALDLEGDGDLDLVVGNAGANTVLENDGRGRFRDATPAHLPDPGERVTQDLEAADVNGDGALDLLEANEDGNRILLGDGRGAFAEAADPAARYPAPAGGEETREIDAGDVDGDGDLDLVVANVAWNGLPGADRLLLGDGTGRFVDAAAGRLPTVEANTVDAKLVDLDADGDLDLVTASAFSGADAWRVLENDGHGAFADVGADWLPRPLAGNGVDVAAADFDGDDVLDLYLANHSSRDLLLLSAPTRPTATPTRTPRPTALPSPTRHPTPTPAPTARPAPPGGWRVWLPWGGRAP